MLADVNQPKILLAVHHFPPRYKGGAELRAYRTAVALQQRGHEVRVLCVEHIDSGPIDGGVAWEDEDYHGVTVRRLSFDLSATPDRFRWSYDNPWVGEHLQAMIHDWTPDIFHLIGGYLMTASVLKAAHDRHIPNIVTLTDFWWLCPRISMLRSNGQLSTLPISPVRCARCLGEESRRYRWPGQTISPLMSLFWKTQKHKIHQVVDRQQRLLDVLNNVNAIISPSLFLQKMHTEAGIRPEKIIYSRQGRDFPELKPELLEKTPSDRLRVGYIGQIAHLKGVHVLFEAVKRIPQAKLSLQVWGDPSHFPKYTALLHRLSDGDPRVEMAGVYQQGEVSKVVHDLDVIVVPSLWYENSPNVILEAFAHQTPVIASNLGGMAELVHHDKNGLLFDPGNASQLACQIQRLIEEPGLLKTLRQGIEPVKSVALELDEMESIYTQVSKQR